MEKDYNIDEIQKFICRFTSFNFDIDKIQENIDNFIYFCNAKDFLYLNGDENYLNNEKDNDEVIYYNR